MKNIRTRYEEQICMLPLELVKNYKDYKCCNLKSKSGVKVTVFTPF